jgi:ribosome biogenesis protein ERB1
MKKQRPATNAVASSSSTIASGLGKKRSRKQQVAEEEDEDDELSGVVGSGKQVDDEQEDEIDLEEDEEDDEFEIDTGSSNGDLDDFVVADDDDVEEERMPVPSARPGKANGRTSRQNIQVQDDGDLADSESEEDSQAGLDLDDEEGYNSSDIDALDSGDDEEDDGALTPATSLGSSSDLDKLIKKHTSKPSESEYLGDQETHYRGSLVTGGRALTGDGRWGTDKFSSAKEGSGRLRKSKFVEGSWVREYEEFEAGYGSESSTEEVSRVVFFPESLAGETDCRPSLSRRFSLFSLFRTFPYVDSVEHQHDRKHPYRVVRRPTPYRLFGRWETDHEARQG